MTCTAQAQESGFCTQPQSGPKPIRALPPGIVIADDQPEILQVVSLMLQEEFQILGMALNGKEAIEIVLSHAPDILLLDICMPVLNGFEAALKLRLRGSTTKIIFLTMFEDPDFLEAALCVGAFGYILKSHIARDLIPGIKIVLGGHVFASPSVRTSSRSISAPSDAR